MEVAQKDHRFYNFWKDCQQFELEIERLNKVSTKFPWDIVPELNRAGGYRVRSAFHEEMFENILELFWEWKFPDTDEPDNLYKYWR